MKIEHNFDSPDVTPAQKLSFFDSWNTGLKAKVCDTFYDQHTQMIVVLWFHKLEVYCTKSKKVVFTFTTDQKLEVLSILRFEKSKFAVVYDP